MGGERPTDGSTTKWSRNPYGAFGRWEYVARSRSKFDATIGNNDTTGGLWMLWKLTEGVFFPWYLENVPVHRISGYLSIFMPTPDPMYANEPQAENVGQSFWTGTLAPNIPTAKKDQLIFRARQPMHLPQLPAGL